MKPLAEVLAEHHFRAAFGGCVEPCGWQSSEGPDEEREHSAHLAAVVAEWMGSDEAVEVVAEAIFDSTDPHQRKRYEEGNAVSGYDDEYARSALAALAAHAKGEADD